jgi:hypothetical protein
MVDEVLKVLPPEVGFIIGIYDEGSIFWLGFFGRCMFRRWCIRWLCWLRADWTVLRRRRLLNRFA